MRADIVATPSFTLPGLRDRIYDLILARISDPWIIVASARAQWARERKIDLPSSKLMISHVFTNIPQDFPSGVVTSHQPMMVSAITL